MSQINAKWTIFEICAGQHNVFLSECWAKIESPGQARPAPPTVATTLLTSKWLIGRPVVNIIKTNSELRNHLLARILELSPLPLADSSSLMGVACLL